MAHKNGRAIDQTHTCMDPVGLCSKDMVVRERCLKMEAFPNKIFISATNLGAILRLTPLGFCTSGRLAPGTRSELLAETAVQARFGLHCHS